MFTLHGIAEQLRFLQKSATQFVPRLRTSDDVEALKRSLRRTGVDCSDLHLEAAAKDAAMCTCSTHR